MHLLIVLVNGDVVKCYGVPKALAAPESMLTLRAKVHEKLAPKNKGRSPSEKICVRLQHTECEMLESCWAANAAPATFDHLSNDIMEYVG